MYRHGYKHCYSSSNPLTHKFLNWKWQKSQCVFRFQRSHKAYENEARKYWSNHRIQQLLSSYCNITLLSWYFGQLCFNSKSLRFDESLLTAGSIRSFPQMFDWIMSHKNGSVFSSCSFSVCIGVCDWDWHYTVCYSTEHLNSFLMSLEP